MKRIVIAMLLCAGLVAAQQSGVLNWNPNGSNITVTGPASAGTTFSFALPAKSGTFAMTSDIPSPTVTAMPIFSSGTITLVNGTGSAMVASTVVRCIVSDGSGNSVKYSRLGASLTVFGVGPTIDYACF
jgi:hypothetical protein